MDDRRMKSLTNKSLSQFFVCVLIILLLFVPLFFLITKYYYAEDLMDVIEEVGKGNGVPALDLEEDIIIGMMIQFVLIFAVLAIAFLVTLRFVTRKLWLPFYDTLWKMENFNIAHDDMPEFTETSIMEFERLNHSLGELMERDRKSYRIQKEFTENASHELQTPIAIIRNKLDMLIQEPLNERQMRLVSSLYDVSTRMEHLNSNLLLLARIENSQYKKTEDIDPAQSVRNLLPSYDVFLQGITLDFSDNRSVPSTICANAVLLDSLVNNLVINAIRHTDSPTGKIAVCIRDGCLTISNEGQKALNPRVLFRRFRSGDSHRVGNGLGLSIVKSICDYHGWKVVYSFEDGWHVFTVVF